MDKYDSTEDTKAHIKRVNQLLFVAGEKLRERALNHDASKLQSPEKEAFDEHTPSLAGQTYGSEKYVESLERMKETLAHHYENNTHHPQHYKLWVCPICGKHKREEDTWVSDSGHRFCLSCTAGHAIYEAELTDNDRITSIDGFDLFDLMEMFMDWKASSERHDDGNIYRSIMINKARFRISDQVTNILMNTAKRLNF